MTPVFCTTKHAPDNGEYGDCVRACIASMLDMKSEQVPHFYHDGDGEAAFDRQREFLRERGLAPAYFPIDADADPFGFMASNYPGVEYLLFCRTKDGNHCVVGRNDQVIHDPAWYRTAIEGPHSSGVWVVILLARF